MGNIRSDLPRELYDIRHHGEESRALMSSAGVNPWRQVDPAQGFGRASDRFIPETGIDAVAGSQSTHAPISLGSEFIASAAVRDYNKAAIALGFFFLRPQIVSDPKSVERLVFSDSGSEQAQKARIAYRDGPIVALTKLITGNHAILQNMSNIVEAEDLKRALEVFLAGHYPSLKSASDAAATYSQDNPAPALARQASEEAISGVYLKIANLTCLTAKPALKFSRDQRLLTFAEASLEAGSNKEKCRLLADSLVQDQPDSQALVRCRKLLEEGARAKAFPG